MLIQYHSDFHLEFNFKIAKIFEIDKKQRVIIFALVDG
jgi:hypothetical protein